MMADGLRAVDREESRKKRRKHADNSNKMDEEYLVFFSQSKAPWNMLSNFYEVDIGLPEGTFPSVEHYFQATKFIAEDRNRFRKGAEFDRHVERKQITAVTKGRFAKSAGSKSGSAKHNLTLVADAFEPAKAKRRMKDALLEKFKQEPFRQVLLNTGNRPLVHIGMRGSLDYWTGKVDKSTGEIIGENTMAKLLMEVRDEIQDRGGDHVLHAET